MAASIPSGCQQFFEQYIPMSVICIIALSQNRFKIFSLCRYKVITIGSRYSGKQVVQVCARTPCTDYDKKASSRKPPSRRKATDLSPFLVLPGIWLKVSQMDSPLPPSCTAPST